MSKTERLLSSWERFNWYLNETDPANISVVIKVTGKLTRTLIQDAINHLQKKYYLLNVVVKHDSSSQLCYFSENIHKIPLRWVKRRGEKQWLQEHNREIHTLFDPNSHDPLVRAVFLKGKKRHEILFTFHHMIIDGISCFDLIDTFLKKICPLQTPSDEICAPYQPLDKQLSLTNPKHQDDTKVNEWRKKASSLKEVENAKETGVIFKKLSTESTLCFLKRCKENQLTVNSAVSAALILALNESMKKKSGMSANSVRLDCPIDLRTFFSQHPSNLGFYAATLTLYLSLSGTDILALGKEIQGEIHKEKNVLLLQQTMQVVDLMMNNHFSGQEIKTITRAEGPYVGVSNLGRFHLYQNNKAVSIDAVYLSAALHGFFYTENSIYGVVHTINENLFFSFIYPKLLISENEIKFIIDNFFCLLKIKEE